YTWTKPDGWVGTSITNTLPVTSGELSGLITVVANNLCGPSAAAELIVNVAGGPPAITGVINGPASPCAGAAVTYSVAAAPGADEYEWTLPPGWTGTSTSNTINVTVGGANGQVKVRAKNSCGDGP